jgi:hypothetical protein
VDVKEQRAIAHILGTLDDKIELNCKQNETLEAMARALFKAWFVDFEPVCAKEEGRWRRGQSLPGLPAHLYDLFPDRLVESELGEIPRGWRHSTIGEEVTVCGGSTPSTGAEVLGRWATLLGNAQGPVRPEVSRFAGHGSKDYGCRSGKDQFWPLASWHGVALFTGTNRLFGDCRSSNGDQPGLHRDEM